MNKLIFLAAGVFTCFFAAAAIIYTANFAGVWTLNSEKSVFGNFGQNIAPKKITISNSENSVTIERLSPTMSGGDYTSKEILPFDGRETETTLSGNNKKNSKAKWSADGESLLVSSVIHWEMNGELTEIKLEEVWKLNAEGQLTLQSISNSSFGTLEMKLVYDRMK